MYDVVCGLLEQRLETQFTDVPIAWDNVEFIPTPGAQFIRPIITQTLSSALSLGGNYTRDSGLLTVQVFTAAKEGSRPNKTLSTRVLNAFKGYAVDSLFCGFPYVQRVGQENEWFHENVQIEFYFDNCL